MEENSENFSDGPSVLFLCSRHILIFEDISKNLYLWKRAGEQNLDNFSERQSLLFFLQPQYDNFLKNYDKSFTGGSVMMHRIQNTFQNIEVYYFYAAAIYQISKIL